MKLRCDQINAQSFMACAMTNLCLKKPFTCDQRQNIIIYSVASSPVPVEELVYKKRSFSSMERVTLQ